MNFQTAEIKSPLKYLLAEKIEGEVRFDKGDLSLYSTDSSNYRFIPIGVVIPKNKHDIINTINLCRELDVPIVSRGGGTSLAGQTVNEAVIIDMSKYYHHVLEINAEEKWVRVEPGIVLDKLNQLTGEYNLMVGPDPATHTHCTIGGMLGNNSCGVHAQWAGKMQENTLELEVMTYEGDIFTVGETSLEELESILRGNDKKAEIYRELLKLRKSYQHKVRKKFPDIPRRVSGYNLEELLEENNFNMARALVGSESTLVTILEAKIKLLEKPKSRSLLVMGFYDIIEAAEQVPVILQCQPIGLEAVDELLKLYVEEKKLFPPGVDSLPEGHAFLLVEFGGENEEDCVQKGQQCLEMIKKYHDLPSQHYRLIVDAEEQLKLWEVRESGLGATARAFGTEANWEGWEDAAVAPHRVAAYLKEFKKLLKKYDYKGSLYGHFGQGCIHTRINFDLKTHHGIEKYYCFIKEAAKLVKDHEGSLSGEHGDGQSRGELLELMYGPDVIKAMNEFKRIWDPRGKMNPGKIVSANSPIANLRLGENHEVYVPDTHFKYPEDKGSFQLATERCVGVGKCRQLEGGTMCPSFQVTQEEKHSTRGRAHLLFEMLKKDTLLKPWKEESVKESLDLCLSCKGCKSDCPVSVDMATYKAEFLSHYHEGKRRSMAAYSMGLIFIWNRLASKIPAIVNFLTQMPPFSWVIKWLGGIDLRRSIPKYAKKTFRHLFDNKERNSSHYPEKKEVILWVDSFNNYFHPDVLMAINNSLEQLGYKVKLPPKNMCCGRPLYDFGFLDRAKRQLHEIMDKMHADINSGIPVIFAEPSCLSVFQDELINLFPNDLRAIRLNKQCFTLSQFLVQEEIELDVPPAQKRLHLHGHCHYKSLNPMVDDVELLNQIAHTEKMETGCCGMAGAFGFEAGEKCDVSFKIANHDLIPKVKNNDANSILVADGFSCREQVKHMLGFYPRHSAHIIQEALNKKFMH
jgi:FAD/FMN-containing dehydrogenase/Fe-S oxidoreductase